MAEQIDTNEHIVVKLEPLFGDGEEDTDEQVESPVQSQTKIVKMGKELFDCKVGP